MDDETERTIVLDLGSSPDPLIDPILSPPMMPPSAIKTRSQAADRLLTLAPSPRKRTFELDVGNEMSPQRLRVTVEADDNSTRSTSRRLFQSPTPKRRSPQRKETIVTTTVPLRGLSDDEAPAKTPRRRGGPRKSGTPVPQRKRPGTPARRRSNGSRASFSPQKDILTSDINDDATPRPSAQAKRVAKRKASSPIKGDGTPGSQPRKRGRPRKQPVVEDAFATGLDRGNTAEPVPTFDDPIEPTPADGLGGSDQRGDVMYDDTWLATMSEQPTPTAPRWQRDTRPDLPTRDYSSEAPQSELSRPEPQFEPQYDWPDMGGGADSYSEAESVESDTRLHSDAQDTIMRGEDFTMISLGSLPSMQPNSSVMVPEVPEEFGEATSFIIHNTLEDLRRSQIEAAEASKEEPGPASAIEPEAEAEQETADEQVAEKTQNPSQSPEPPLKSPQPWWNQSPRRPKPQPLAKRLARKALLQEDGPSPASHPPPPNELERQETSGYDDSFSEIPEAVLVAATPRRFRQPNPEVEAVPSEDIQPSIERPSRVNHSNPQSETNRLLTPDETPSIPSDPDEHDPQPKPPRPDPEPDLDIPSSPPVRSPIPQHPNGPSAHHIRVSSTETPADQLASFATSNSASRDTQPVQLPAPDQPRPSLTPIVRAGRALQLITSDPPSPPGRDSMLGSPFRGSFSKPSQSPAPISAPIPGPPSERATKSPSLPRAGAGAVAESPRRSWLAPFNQIKEFMVRSAQSLSPARVSVAGTEGMDDPFGPDPVEPTRPGSVRNTLFSGSNRQSQDRDATVSDAGSAGAGSVLEEDAGSVHEDDVDDMSWQAEDGPVEGLQRSDSPETRPFSPPRPENRGGGMVVDERLQSQQSESPRLEPPTPQTNMDEPARDEQEEQEDVNDDDFDIWTFEAERTPYVPKIDPPRREPEPEPPRRGKIPSPWRQTRPGLTYSDEIQQPSEGNAVPEETAAANEDDEFSLLSRSRPGRAPVVAKPPPTNKGDLDGFFSSPATLPDIPGSAGVGLRQTIALGQAQTTGYVTQKPRTMPEAQRPRASGNSLFAQYLESQAQEKPPSIPEKQLHIGERYRRGDLFSPVRSTAERSSPERNSPESSSPVRAPAAVPPPVSSSAPEEEIGQGYIPQLRNFSPRNRHTSQNTLFQPTPVGSRNSLFGNTQVTKFFANSMPRPRPQPRLQEEERREDEDASSFVARPFKPLHRAASPGKSCIRSPLKPKTPGPVVDFTSSTLSPLDQARARAERRASMSPEKGRDEGSKGRGASVGSNSSGSGSRGGSLVQQQEAEKENHTEESHSPSPSVSPSLLPAPAPQPEQPAAVPLPSQQQQQSRRAPGFSSNRLTRPLTTTTTTTTTATTTSPSHTHMHTHLSPRTWTRSHWVRLDELLQARKKGALHFQLYLARSASSPSSSVLPSSPSSPATKQRHALVGKLVTSQGESMALEEWHLDVVEAFREEVLQGNGQKGKEIGWDEAQIAKRVFALLVGEERRRNGVVGERRRTEVGGERRRTGVIGDWRRRRAREEAW